MARILCGESIDMADERSWSPFAPAWIMSGNFRKEITMQWKFWQRKPSGSGGSHSSGTKLPKPKDLPAQIGMYLVVHEKLDPDWVWALRCVLRQRPERRHYFDFRVYDPSAARAANVQVMDYTSLDAHPELVLFKGLYDKDVRDPELDRTPHISGAA
jgi:hypothetical protein